MDNPTLPIGTQTKIIYQRDMAIYYPEIFGLRNFYIQKQMNTIIFELVQSLITLQIEQQNTNSFAEMIGTYEIKTNERNILSLTITNYTYVNHATHGLTFIKSLTFNVKTGHSYKLNELFKPDSNYVAVLSNNVKGQIEDRNIPLLNKFTTISPNQDFYLADKSLVLYFQLYEITPYYVGLPMFPISVFEIDDIAITDGPIDKMATNN